MARWRGGVMSDAPTVDESEVPLKVPMKVQLIVEPTPFTHVSGYANRFKEYLKYQKKAGATVSIITPDDSSESFTVQGGDTFVVEAGFQGTWHIEQAVRKFFDYTCKDENCT